MANKHLTEDQIQYTVDVKTSKAQQEVHKLEVQSASLRNENKQRLQQMIKLEASGKKETEQYKSLAASYKDTGRQIRELSSRIQEQTRSLDINVMTMSQLKKQAKTLQKELDNVSQSLNPQQYAALENNLQAVNSRMAELKTNARSLKEITSSDGFKNFFLGQLAAKGIETAVAWGKSLIGTLSETIEKSTELAESADGVVHAFEKIGTEDYLQTLRDATKGTVSDIELMKAAVKAKDFRIPLEDLGKYLSFAQLTAQQTGQELDYMVDSIVTGLGRQSPQILDNLGLSAAEIKEQTKETGDFMKGVATIVEKNLAAAGETYISAADRAAKRTADLENAQLSLGKALVPIKEEFTDIYGQIQIGVINAITYIVKHRDTLMILIKVVGLLTATYLSYVAAQKVAYLWSLRAVAVSKLKAAAAAVENTMLQLSILRHAVLNKTMKTSIALQKAFNIVLKLSPWGLLFGGITLVVGSLLLFRKRTDLNIEHQNNLLSIEQSYLTLSENLVIKDAAQKKAIKEQQNKAVADQQQAAYNAYIEAEKQYYDALEKIQETAPAKPQTLQEECDAKLLVLDGYYKAALQRAIEDGERQKEVTEAYEKAKAAIVADYAKKIEEERARARQEYGIDTFTDQLAARRKKIDEDFAKGLLTQEQYNQAIANLEKQAEEQRLQIRQQYGLASQQELYNAELEQLKEHLRQGLITHEEYEEAVSALKRDKWKADFDNYRELFGGAVQELMKAEEANVDAKYDAEIEAARSAGKDTTELEKKKANDKLKIQKKYADINFAIKASQIVADTSVSIMKALGELGPIAGPIAAALMGITGAAQLAAANAERQKVKRMSLNGAGGTSPASGTRVVTGLESGGSIDVEREQDGKRFHADYDPYRRGFIDKPTVIVGEGGYGRSREWVASNAAVENPTVSPILNIIDQAQRAGNIRTLDMNKFLLQQAQGRAAGGYIAPSTPTPQPMPTAITHRDEYNKELLDTLKELRNNGIRSYVVLDDFDAQQKLRNQVRRIASK